jgi:heme/copper-type cytochrome/quinol oxidase subunit 3
MAVADISAHPEQRPRYPGLDPAMMGMFIFLASEVMFFGSMFAMYFYLFGSHPFGWPPPNTVPVNWYPIPAVNTVVLLSSGLTCHFALEAVAHDRRRTFFILLIGTLILGVLFEAGQIYEFSHAQIKFGNTLNTFGSAFFTMTGFHGLHVAGGLVFLTLMLGRALKGQFNSRHHVGFAAATLYWHFVDVVWVFLFGILYLQVTALR